jgi:signal transduction histidine kinase
MRRADPPVRYSDSVMTLLSLAAEADGPSADAVFGNLFDLIAQNKPSARGTVRHDILSAIHTLIQKVTPAARHRVAGHISRMPVELPADLALLLEDMTASSSRSWIYAAQLSQQAWAMLLPKLSMDEVRQVAARNDLPAAIALQLGGIRPMPLLLPAPADWQAAPMAIDALADEVDTLDLAPASQLPANDFSPLANVAAYQHEKTESDQVKNLLERITWFRQRPVPTPDIAAETEQAAPLVVAEDGANQEPIIISPATSLFLLDNPLPEEQIEAAADPEHTNDATIAETAAGDATEMALPALLADVFWETDRQGRFVFVGASSAKSNMPADALRALTGQYLLDWLESSPEHAKAVRSLQRRCSFDGVTLEIADGAFEGHWTFSGVAAFDRASGQFLGHRGAAQRRADIKAEPAGSVPEALALAAHETRTPLNAIMGFAQLIEAQPFGPVSPAYTEQAEAILDASARLLRVLDDVSDASKLDRGLVAIPDDNFNLEALLNSIIGKLSPIAARRSIRFTLRTAAGMPNLWSDRDVVERSITRLIVALLSVTETGETITISSRDGARDHVLISFSRPLALQGLDAAELMAPVRHNDSDGPRLNIGFGLRLAERLAGTVGGHLFFSAASIDLMLPAAPALAALQDAAAQ